MQPLKGSKPAAPSVLWLHGWAAAAMECLRPDVTGNGRHPRDGSALFRRERGTFHSSMCPAREISAGAPTGLFARRTLHIKFMNRHHSSSSPALPIMPHYH